jgi:hypothetical protein
MVAGKDNCIHFPGKKLAYLTVKITPFLLSRKNLPLLHD